MATKKQPARKTAAPAKSTGTKSTGKSAGAKKR